MTNQHITPEEAKAVVDLWDRQQMPLDACPRLADVAEALDIAPEQAQELLEQIRSQQEERGKQSQHAGHTLMKPTARPPGLSPAISGPAVTLLGLASLVWTGWSWQEWASFPLSALSTAGLIASNVGLWALFVKWGRSVYKDGRRRSRSVADLYTSRPEEKTS